MVEVMQKDQVMLYENEVIMLLLGVGISFFILLNRTHIKRINQWRILLASYCFLLAGWLFTILEGFFLESWLNFLEHLCYLFSTLVFAVWCWKTVYSSKVEDKV